MKPRAASVRLILFALGPFAVYVAVSIAASALRPGNTLVRAVAQIGTLLIFGAAAPTLFRLTAMTFDPSPAMEERLLAECRRQGVPVRAVRLYGGLGQTRANALFVGLLPSRRYVFVSDYIANDFTGAELDAVMAHEICHGKEHHLLIRLAVLAFGVLIGGIAGTVGAFMWIAIIFGLGFLDPYFETRADDYGARVVGRDAMVSALIHLGRENHDSFTNRSYGYRGHPGLARRIERLGGTVPVVDVPPRPERKRKPKLPTRWRVVLPLAWISGWAGILYSGRNDPTSNYSALMSWVIGVAFIVGIVIPIAAALGWRWTPWAAVVAAVAGLPPSIADVRDRLPSGTGELSMFLALLAISLAAALSRDVVAVISRRSVAA